jgi:hypothetical protein
MSEIMSVELEGPLFADPGKKMLANITEQAAQLRDAGAAQARRGYEAGSGGRAPISRLGDRVADHVVGRTVARPSEGGRRWAAHGVIQVYNEGLSVQQGRSLMAAASILEGRTNTMRTIARQIGQKLREIDLTKGLE